MEQLDIFDLGVEYHYRPPLYFTRPVRLFEAFAGVGCQAMAFRRAKLPYVSVGISEIDKYAIKSYEAIHGKTTNYGDIKLMGEIPPCDVFTWSFPCTDLSKAGKRKGMTEDTRSGLVYEVLRLLRDTYGYIPHRHTPKRSKIHTMGESTDYYAVGDHSKLPKVLIMENVPDLVQEAFKAQFYEIQKEIATYGYKNFTLTLNAKDFGVAQNRDRVFMVSLLGDYHYEFPMPFRLEKRLKDYLEPNVPEKYYLSDKMIQYFNDNSQANEEKGNGFRFKPQGGDEPAKAITTRAGGRMDDNFVREPTLSQEQSKMRIRKLCPIEVWRLMGISDDDFYKAQKVCSNSQLYKQAGNGIVVDVFAAILKNLISQ